MEFEVMVKEAEKVINKNGANEGRAFALFTNKGNLYIPFCADGCCGFGKKFCKNHNLFNDMIAANDTRIIKIAGVFKQTELAKQTGIDIPCAWILQFICSMNKENVNAEILMSSNGTKTLKACCPLNLERVCQKN
ncbi:hypothetical protein EUCA11A_35210 [Eubacterium callanderi]|nr:hypothetical protein [Eubacterium callanderi]WPK69333.1 hypothetical protein EUCA2A_35210 [Eubacterium callanderi]WPK73631.1 hypothetical protein EUCA11A_35210 [Eubacterium callanderi]